MKGTVKVMGRCKARGENGVLKLDKLLDLPEGSEQRESIGTLNEEVTEA